MLPRGIRWLASLKFAVANILVIATLTAVGTFVEAEYNATIAQKLVYKSAWMYLTLIVFAVNLIAVMVDRWPWKARHVPFLMAHVGIIMVLVGAWVTQRWGIDGSLRVGIGESQKFVTLPETRIQVYASYDGDSYRTLHRQDVDFYMTPPQNKPVVVDLGGHQLEIIDSYPFAVGQSRWQASPVSSDPPAVRFQLENANVNVSQWLSPRTSQPVAVLDLGPARVEIGRTPQKASGVNQIQMWPHKGGKLWVAVRDKSGRTVVERAAGAGEEINTGWMGLTFRILDYFPAGREKVEFRPLTRPTATSTSAIAVRYKGEVHWVGLNSMLRLFDESTGYVFTYQNALVDLGFDVQLKDFRVGRYPGSLQAASYESVVSVPGRDNQLIAMNEPLKHDGYTLYQASFEENEKGQPVASVLSVNYDPGRELKYLGSLIIVLGSALLFYRKRRAARWARGAA